MIKITGFAGGVLIVALGGFCVWAGIVSILSSSGLSALWCLLGVAEIMLGLSVIELAGL